VSHLFLTTQLKGNHEHLDQVLPRLPVHVPEQLARQEDRSCMNHIPSPDNSDPSIEREILDKGLTAPRITPKSIQGNIVSEHYFTALQGAEEAEGLCDKDGYPIQRSVSLGLLTFCVLVLRNGFTVTGESACASPENFDADIGKRIARANAEQKIWPLMGYLLREQLYWESHV